MSAAGKPDAAASVHDWPPSVEAMISLEEPSSPKKLATQSVGSAHETLPRGPMPGGTLAAAQVAPSSEL